MGPADAGPFLHSDHLADLSAVFPLANPAEGCGECHLPVFDAGALDLHEKTYEQASCGECHLDEQGGGLDFDATLRSDLPSLAAGTFAHSDHLRLDSGSRDLATPEAYSEIESQGCHACHLPGFHEALQEQTFLVDAERASFEGCAGCHDVEPWRAPLDLPGGGHGDWSAEPKNCTRCHAFGEPDMAANRPRVARAELIRRRPAAFQVVWQEHRFITTGETGSVAEDCGECHLAPVEKLPTRIEERPFRHSTHLPLLNEENGSEVLDRCETCHTGAIANTPSSRGVGRYRGEALITRQGDPDHYGLTYDPEACQTCHLGSVLVPDFDPPEPAEGQPRPGEGGAEPWIYDFPHDIHVDAELPWGGRATCLTCHVEPEGRSAYADGDVGVLPTARDCTMCHQHEERDAPISGGAGPAAVQSCALCHGDSVPAVEAVIPVQRQFVAAVRGTQFHPPGQDCSSCHVNVERGIWRLLPEEVRIGSAGLELSVETGEPDVHRKGKPDQCMDCHWARSVIGLPDPISNERGVLGDDMTCRGVNRRYPGDPKAEERVPR